MTVNEMKELLLRKVNETEAQMKSAKNGDKLQIKTAITYMDSKCNESSEYAPGVHTMLLGTVFVRSAENNADEDPEFSYSIAAVINQKGEVEEDNLESEYLEFDSRVFDFVRRLGNATNIEALITAEHDMIEDESKDMVQRVEDRLNKLKRRGIYVVLAIGAMLLITAIVRIFI